MKMKRTTRKAWKTSTGVQLYLWYWPERVNREPKKTVLDKHIPFDPFR